MVESICVRPLLCFLFMPAGLCPMGGPLEKREKPRPFMPSKEAGAYNSADADRGTCPMPISRPKRRTDRFLIKVMISALPCSMLE